MQIYAARTLQRKDLLKHFSEGLKTKYAEVRFIAKYDSTQIGFVQISSLETKF